MSLKTSIRFAAHCLILTVFLSSCAFAAGSVEVTVTSPQSSTSSMPIAARVGDTFVIKLESNHTTGYQWQLSGTPDAKVVQKVGSAYNEPEKPIPGRGGSESWTFKAVGKGKATIKLIYVRPWEKNVAPIRTQAFAVTVQ